MRIVTKNFIVLKRSGTWYGCLFGKISVDDFADDVSDPSSGKVLHKKGHLLSKEEALKLKKQGTFSCVRSPLTCEAENGVCAKCYGIDLGKHID